MGKGHPDFISKKHPDFGKRENPTLRDFMTESIRGALASTGCEAKLVDNIFVGNFAGELFCQQGHLGAAVADAHPDLLYKPAMRVEGACASGALAAMGGVQAIRAGQDVVLIAGAEVQSSVNAKEGGTYLARAADYHRQASIDELAFPALFARRTKAMCDAYGKDFLTGLGAVSAKAYANGAKNPLAHMHAVASKMTLAHCSSVGNPKNPNFLGNEEYKDYIRLTDCSQVSDGGSAMIMVSEEGLKKLGKSPSDCVEVVGADWGTGDLWHDPPDLTQMSTTKAVVARLFSSTGMTIKDIKVAEVHDCFTTAEVLMTEATGIAKKGEGVQAAIDGYTSLDGELPVNTGGGLIAFGHPVGATGVKQILEVFRQMKGQCGEYQMKARPETGLTVNMGGDDNTCAAMVLKNC